MFVVFKRSTDVLIRPFREHLSWYTRMSVGNMELLILKLSIEGIKQNTTPVFRFLFHSRVFVTDLSLDDRFCVASSLIKSSYSEDKQFGILVLR